MYRTGVIEAGVLEGAEVKVLGGEREQSAGRNWGQGTRGNWAQGTEINLESQKSEENIRFHKLRGCYRIQRREFEKWGPPVLHLILSPTQG